MKCDVRIVAATNENLEKAIADGRFREDLYYRLNEFTINIPPLRECPDDILPLAEFFLSHSVEELKREPLSLSAEAKKRIQVYDWPGNVRELKNTIRRAALIAEGKAVSVDDLGLAHRVVAKPASDDEDEREKIIKALEATQYNKTRAAEKLNMHRSTLHEKLKKYGIEAEK
jgi:two-component system response regulator HydG